MAFAKKCPGGTEIEISMLFVDMRGSSRLAEQMTATEFSRLLHRFYKAATDALIETDAVIDKLVGDEVIGLYLPLFTGPDHPRHAVLAARRLLEVTGHGEERDPWVPIGIGVHTGNAFVGTVSGEDGTVSDITALGDAMNVTARLASVARPGEALITEAAYLAAGVDLGEPERRRLELRGRSEPVEARVLRLGR
jgi:adenylate cyclase